MEAQPQCLVVGEGEEQDSEQGGDRSQRAAPKPIGTRGGYRDKIDPHKAQREFHREVHEKRAAERLKSDQEALNRQQQADLLLAEFAAMPAELQLAVKDKLQAQAEREGFTRMRGWGEEHPVWRGLLAEYLRVNALVLAGSS